ncbi:efflux RND transporter periplasmic adaptor subunit [Methylocella sp. CPCC 101449]|uniref:efflux RND transporter periplasmic adaptor subunit n=1 Tax=Methylocella sp. CPCC 101449 TaxID=2987531 RepID=UPI00288F4E7C|nr:efflux RND transporter periplasmic adaptor subunit [Methylocella sp. CPCC 101449]MDT2024245.1 efflux RND transporter periplasmic adaptor subunit [Methylocella sp. CPCC 101449]
MRTKLLSLLTLSLALPLAACNDKKKDEPEIVRPVLSVVVQPRSDSEQGFVGSIEPRISAPLSFRLLGRLIARNVNVSSVVTKGATIASLDPTTLQLQVQAARADLSSAEAQFSNAAGNEERQRTLLQSKNTPQSTYDAALQVRDSAQAGVEQAQAALAKAEEQLTYSQLFSDFDGVVTSVGAEVGQVVSAGQMVVTVARSDQRIAVVDIPDQLTAGLTTGTEFNVVLQSAPTVRAVGSVYEIAPQADAVTRTRRVKLNLANPPVGLRLGSTVNVTRDVAVKPSISLPLTALVENDGKASVWTVDPANSTVALQAITVASKEDGTIIVGGGLTAGARVVIAGVHSLRPGQKVKINGEAQP